MKKLMSNKYIIGISINDVLRDNTGALIDNYESDFGKLSDELKKKVNFHYPSDTLFSSKEKECDYIYNESIFQLFASPDTTYDNIQDDVDSITKFFEDEEEFNNVEFVVLSKETNRTKSATFQFLAKSFLKFDKYIFVKKDEELFNYCDCLVTSDEKLVKYKNENKSLILFQRDYNKETNMEGIDLKIKRLNQIINPSFLKEKLKNA